MAGARESQSRRVLCTPYNHAPCHFMQSHLRKVYACLAVTCHLRFWQNDLGLLRATAVTRGWNGYRNDIMNAQRTHKEHSVHHHLIMQHPVCLFQERTKNSQFIIISLCNILFVCFRNAQRTLSSSSSHYATSCLSVSGTHKERSVHHHLST